MQINRIATVPTFKRLLKPSEEKEYSDVLELAKEKAARGKGKNLLIIPMKIILNNTQYFLI